MRRTISARFYGYSTSDLRTDLLQMLNIATTEGLVVTERGPEPVLNSKQRIVTPYEGDLVTLVDKVLLNDRQLTTFSLVIREKYSNPGDLQPNNVLIQVGINSLNPSLGMDVPFLVCTLSNDNLIYQEQVFSIVKRIGAKFFAYFHLSYGGIDYSSTFSFLTDQQKQASQLNTLLFANYFGRDLVNQLGESFLLQAPVYLAQKLLNNGVYIQLGQHLSSYEPKLHDEAIMKYFHGKGLEHITWPPREYL